MQTLIRQLQEMWLFGQLNTLGESQVQRDTNANAKAVVGLLAQLLVDRPTEGRPTVINGVESAGEDMSPVATLEGQGEGGDF